MRVIYLTLAALSLASCAQRQAMDDIAAACTGSAGGISAECAKKHPQFQNLPRNAQQQVAYRIMLNEQIKAKKLTEAEGDVIQKEYESKLLANEAAANAANAAASQASSNAMMMTGAALIAAGQPQGGVIYPAPQQMYPRSTTCMGGYRSVTCSNF